jgi:hypothetical protein
VALVILDEDGDRVVLTDDDAASLFKATQDLAGATVSACPECRSRVVACLALVDLLDDAAPHARSNDLIELADDAPSSHLYVYDRDAHCRHQRWLDPGHSEWSDVVRREVPRRR